MSTVQSTYTFVTENGDIVRDIIRTENINNDTKIETVQRYINERFVSTTRTEFVNGYKHGYQRIIKENGNGTNQVFTNRYINGELQNS
jgi:hypothetical protein